MPSEERRSQLVATAFELVAQHGFEGFRTRDVAEAARINNATLHHYFPTKEHLIAAVAEELAARFASEKAPAPAATDALGELRRQFRDVEYYARSRPELIVVYRELVARAYRDAGTRALVQELNRSWQRDVELIILRGKSEGVFRADCDAKATASALVAALWGFVTLLEPAAAAYKRSCAELESAILTPKFRKKAESK